MEDEEERGDQRNTREQTKTESLEEKGRRGEPREGNRAGETGRKGGEQQTSFFYESLLMHAVCEHNIGGKEISSK